MATTNNELLFHWSDYLVFVLSLVLSGSVGVIQGVVDAIRTRKNAKNVADGENKGQSQGQGSTAASERNISVWPASLSVMASTLAAPFVLGVPAEIYACGTEFSLVVLGYLIGVPFVTHFLFVRFYDLEITSIYEYLEFRYSRGVRSLCTFIFALTIAVYIGIITYAPAVAFSQVTGLPMTLSVLGVGLIGIVYTTVGGLKGVIWVDAIQMLIILASVIAIIAKGTAAVGGMDTVWQRAMDGGRLVFDEVSVNPLTRHTLWTQTIGGSFVLCVIFTNQAIVQKFLGLKTRKQMIITSYVSMIAIISYILLFCLAGLVIYAYYFDCSPLLSGKIKRLDQLMPVFVLEIFQGFYGFSGLFTAAVFSASLSSMAGGINALAAVTILDVINPLYTKRTGKKQIAPKRMIFLFKGLVIVYGFITIGFAYLAPYMGSGLLQLALNLLGVVGAPMLALFFMGIFMPCINALGAAVGLLVSLAFMLWLSFGGVYVTGKYSLHIRQLLPLNGTCPASNVGDVIVNNVTQAFTTASSYLAGTTDVTGNSTTAVVPTGYGDPTSFERFYLVSYMWYYIIGAALTMIIAFLVSWASGFRRGVPVDKALSFMCCYTKAEEPLTAEDAEKEKAASTMNGGTVNPAMEPETVGLVPYEEVDDVGVYNYGFVRDRCSRCRRSRVVHCTRF